MKYDINDRIRKDPKAVLDPERESVMARAKPMNDAEWRDRLICRETKSGSVVQKILVNVATILRHHPAWKGAVSYDSFADQILISKACPVGEPGRWSDVHDLRGATWMQASEFEIAVTPELFSQAVVLVAHDSARDPLREHIESLSWDGVARLDTWLVKYLGAEDVAYSHEVGAKFLIGAVARAVTPGAKLDTMLVLLGKQGARKSTAARIIAGGYFTDELQDLSRPADAALQLLGRWIVEVAELDALSRADVSKVKAFITRSTDRFRKPYGRHVEEHPRRCAFIGTSNVDDFQRDETGGRRFWPVRIGAIDVEALQADRDQLIAEAAVRHLAGESWWLEDVAGNERATEAQASVYHADVWEDPISIFLDTPTVKLRRYVTIGHVLEALGVEKPKWTQSDQNRVARCLRSLGWERKQVRVDARREWRYQIATTTPVTVLPMTGDASGDDGSAGIPRSSTTVSTVTTNSYRVHTDNSSPGNRVATVGGTGADRGRLVTGDSGGGGS